MKRAYIALFSSIATSEKMAALPTDAARLFFLALLPQCDAWGRIEAAPPVLSAKVWPMWGHAPNETQEARDACATVGLLEVHATGGRSWVQVLRWDELAGRIGRVDRRGDSEWPDPLDHSRITPGVVGSGPEYSTQRRGEESRGEEKRRERQAPKSPAGSSPGRKPATGHLADCQRHWDAEFLRTRGAAWAWNARDSSAVAKVLRDVKDATPSEVCLRMTRLLGDSDSWVAKNARPAMLEDRWSQLGFVVLKNNHEPPAHSALRSLIAKEGIGP